MVFKQQQGYCLSHRARAQHEELLSHTASSPSRVWRRLRRQICPIYPPLARSCSSNDSAQPRPAPSFTPFTPPRVAERRGPVFPQRSWDQWAVLADAVFHGLKGDHSRKVIFRTEKQSFSISRGCEWRPDLSINSKSNLLLWLSPSPPWITQVVLCDSH